MPQFPYQVRPTRLAMLTEAPTEREAAVIGRHFAYLQSLTSAGKVLMAGRTLNNDETTFGIAIIVADSEEEALAIMQADPAVAEGVMRAKLFPYRIALWSAAGSKS